MGNKVIWITGASTGIGRELAKVLAKTGNIIVVTARRKSRLTSLVNEIKFAGNHASAFVCNVTSERSVQITTKRIREKHGKIDCLINNAGVTVFKSLQETKVYDYDYVLNTNLRGAFLCIKAVLPEMIKRKNGHIINVLSVAALKPFTNSAVYSASKAGLFALANCLREEVRKFNIKVTNILPGATETPMWDSKTRQKYHRRMMSPRELAITIASIIETPKKVHLEEVIVRPIKGDL